ncbi:MAG: hypothetical protein WC729_10025 [Sphingomonas sp.]|jgi:ornithine cyclodeaminase|uniref:ornithine cyclodeaminase family protein n=1 Tax=Sphingomonas sp. TaxID=28214 RepID=UPI003567DEF7
MSVPIIDREQLQSLVSFEGLIEPVSYAFQQSSAGKAENGFVAMFPIADRTRGDVYVKTGTLDGAPVHIVKVAPWFAINVEQGQPQGGFLAVFDSRTGHTLALLDDRHYLSDIRTAAAGALAARMLAPARVGTASVLGSGVQAYWQTLALYGERPFEMLKIWARDPVKAEALAHRLLARLPGIEVQCHTDLRHVVEAGDVVLTTTLSREPILRGEWLRPGQHVTAVGADDPSKCELDAAALGRARVFVDSIETAVANGDVHRAIAAGAYERDAIAGEIGDVLAGRTIGRRGADDITIATFVGIGAQDLVAAQAVVEKAGIRV